MRLLVLALAATLSITASAAAKPTLRGVGDFDQPDLVTAPPGDQRLFVVTVPGVIRVVGQDGTLARRPFLDVSTNTATGPEQGLLGLAFAPDYATTGEFFVFVTTKDPEDQIQVRRYHVSKRDPNVADAKTYDTILRVDKPGGPHHNGGGLHFGPDGKLWVTTGDGGESYDTYKQAQDGQSLLGKVLRIERDGSPAAGNPVVENTRPEIWQRGLRNPFRFSFDRGTGDLYIGDVGEEQREEVDVARAADGRNPGGNWGWSCLEGTLKAGECTAPTATPPYFEADHKQDGNRSISAGIVVRDPGLPTLNGRFLYGDLGFNRLHSLTTTGAKDRAEDGLIEEAVVSVDEDGCGRPVLTSINGRVSRVVDGRLSPCADPVDTPAVPQVTRCGLSLRANGGQTRAIVRKKGLKITVRTQTPCTLELRLDKGRARTLNLVPGAAQPVRFRKGRAVGRRVTVTATTTQAKTTARKQYRIRLG